MGRSPQKGVKYFPHDTDASQRTTLFALESKFGNDGYAFWFKLLEVMGRKDDAAIYCDDSAQWYYLLHYVKMSEQQALEIIEELVKLKAIDPDLWRHRRIIWSDNFIDRLQVLFRKRKEGAPRKPSLNPEEDNIEPEPQKPFSAEEKHISDAEKADSEPQKPILEEENPFGLTFDEIEKARNTEDALEHAARQAGLPFYQMQITKALQLVSIYGLEAVITAIEKTATGPSITWNYVNGILKKEAAQANGKVYVGSTNGRKVPSSQRTEPEQFRDGLV